MYLKKYGALTAGLLSGSSKGVTRNGDTSRIWKGENDQKFVFLSASFVGRFFIV
jgi:hypothetical protein